MKKKDIIWNNNGWSTLQDADAELHQLEISIRAEEGTVVELIIRHNDGENRPGTASLDGENVLPMPIAKFKELYNKGKLLIK